jgi:hypothetical protein
MSSDQQQTPQENKPKRESYDYQSALAIIGAGLANAITLLQINGPFTFWNMITGSIILLILSAFPPAPPQEPSPIAPRSLPLNLAYAAVWSISFLSTFGIVFNIIFSLLGGSFPDTGPNVDFTPYPKYKRNTFTPFNAYDISFFVTWLVTFLIFFYIFSRMRNKDQIKSASREKQPVTKQETPQAKEENISSSPAHLTDMP